MLQRVTPPDPHPGNRELLARGQAVMPGGVLASYRMPDEVAFVAARGQGGCVYDCEGNEYIDYVLGSGPMILGHQHPKVVAALHAQIDHGTQFYTLNEAAIALAEWLVAAIPCAGQVKLVLGGSDATFHALRVARAATGREKVLQFRGAYHGYHDYALRTSPISALGVPDRVADLVIAGPYNDLPATVELLERHAGELAAVLVEPVQRNTPPRPGFLEGLRGATAKHGIVLIFDEVVTGFRLAWGGAQERFGVLPDLAAYGKVIGGGLPLGAVAGRGELMEFMNPRRPPESYAYCTGTLNGNPLSAAAGLATLRVLSEPGTYRKLAALARLLRSGLSEAAARASFPVQIVGDSSLVGVLFASGDPFDPQTAAGSDAARRQRVNSELIKHGIFVNLATKFYLSTVHDEDQIRRTVTAFQQALAAAA
jgi:glutamate-1-semialdehyde 2,1-aminomutase